MLDRAKLALRLTTNAYNDEINMLIDACKSDLQLAGVLSEKIDITDVLIQRAILTYVKAHFGWENADYDRLNASYANIKQHLLLSREYTHV